MEIIKDIAAIVGCILSIISLVTLCTKGGRSFVTKLFLKKTQEIRSENEQQTKDIEEIRETLKLVLNKFDGLEECSRQQCRNTIKNIYYKYQGQKSIPLFERKTVDKTYYIYHEVLGGNSYATLLHDEICKWNIEPASKDDIDEE